MLLVAEALLSSWPTDSYRGRRRVDFGGLAKDDGATAGTVATLEDRGNAITAPATIIPIREPPRTITQVPPQTLPSTEVCAPERSKIHSAQQLKPNKRWNRPTNKLDRLASKMCY